MHQQRQGPRITQCPWQAGLIGKVLARYYGVERRGRALAQLLSDFRVDPRHRLEALVPKERRGEFHVINVFHQFRQRTGYMRGLRVGAALVLLGRHRVFIA